MKNIFVKTLMLKGQAGGTIDKIEKTGTSGLIDTYTVTYNDGDTSTFEVTNGNGIVSIEHTSSSGYYDTYTITFTDGTTDTFTVKNGEDGAGYEVPAGSVLYFDSSADVPEGYEASSNPDASELNNKSNVLSVAEFSTTFTGNQSSGNVNIDITRSGYTALGIVGITGSNTSVLSWADFYLTSNTNARVYYYNRSPGSTEITITVKILFVKN